MRVKGESMNALKKLIVLLAVVLAGTSLQAWRGGWGYGPGWGYWGGPGWGYGLGATIATLPAIAAASSAAQSNQQVAQSQSALVKAQREQNRLLRQQNQLLQQQLGRVGVPKANQ